MRVEFLRAWSDHTWDTTTIEWPGDFDAHEPDMEEWYEEEFPNEDLVAIKVYHIYTEDEI